MAPLPHAPSIVQAALQPSPRRKITVVALLSAFDHPVAARGFDRTCRTAAITVHGIAIVALFRVIEVERVITTHWNCAVCVTAIAAHIVTIVALLNAFRHAVAAHTFERTDRATAVATIGIAVVTFLTAVGEPVTANDVEEAIGATACRVRAVLRAVVTFFVGLNAAIATHARHGNAHRRSIRHTAAQIGRILEGIDKTAVAATRRVVGHGRITECEVNRTHRAGRIHAQNLELRIATGRFAQKIVCQNIDHITCRIDIHRVAIVHRVTRRVTIALRTT